MLASICLVVISTSGFATEKNTSKKQYTQTTYNKSQKRQTVPVRTKEYKVPGAAVLGYAKKHGYQFPSGRGLERIGKRRYKRSKCTSMGMHWNIPAEKSCKITGFRTTKSKCEQLRVGWKVKEVRVKGSFVWNHRPVNVTKPLFVINAYNDSSKAKPVMVEWVVLEGPEGSFNKWQEAFNHCSDPNYQP